MPLIETKGAASAQGFGEFAASSGAVTYIEDVFSTYLYTGNGSTQTITNGIDLSTKGGLVWFKGRNTASNNRLYDTARGMTAAVGGAPYLYSNDTAGNLGTGFAGTVVATSSGFNITQGGIGDISDNGSTYASWTFRKQPKFFDVVTYTGNGSTQTISHNLGSVPGCIIVKRVSAASNTGWPVYHRYDYQQHGFLNLTNGFTGAQEETWFGNNVISVAPTSTVFTVGSNQDINANTNTYVAYLFAHNAGGFGLTGTDNVISCGSFTTASGSGIVDVTLGYEPQWVLFKTTGTADDWVIMDNMRGFPVAGSANALRPNASNAESGFGTGNYPTATGFHLELASAQPYIYIAIRRGPMKVPTDATKVFTPIAATPSAGATASIAVTPDMFLFKGRSITDPFWTEDRLRFFAQVNTSSAKQLQVNSTTAEQTQLPIAYYIQNANMLWGSYLTGTASIIYNFKRAPSFFDEVCYTGTGSLRTVSHNLGAVPELLIVKRRDTAEDWNVYSATIGNAAYLRLNTTAAIGTAGADALWGSTTPTSSVFTVKTSGGTNASGGTFVAYLFATCAGVSKVGSYTGTGSLTTINCGFTGGARFVLIKRTDAESGWYVWDTARGMVSGTDPSLRLNSAVGEINDNSVYTITTGFQLLASPSADVNTNGGTYIFLAIA